MISDRFSHHRDQIATKAEKERLWGKVDSVSPQREAELDTRTDHLCMAADADLILRYQATVEKELHRNYALLTQLQSRRRFAGAGACVTSPSDQEPMKSEIQMTRTDVVSGVDNDSCEFPPVQSVGNVAEKLTERPALDVDGNESDH